MTVRACLGVGAERCGLQIPANRRRCAKHERQNEQLRISRRRVPYDRAHQRRARQVIAAEPWCHWSGCGATEDLTADHVDPTNPDSELVPLCRSHNVAARHLRDKAAKAVRT